MADLSKWLKTLLSRPKRKKDSGQKKIETPIQTSTVDAGSWVIWDSRVEEWREWPSERLEPLARPIEFLHTKHVGAMMLHVYRDIDGTFIGCFFKPDEA
jgi:hypothetical protein